MPEPRIVLSRRNLLSLLHKLEMKDSARTIIKYTDSDEPLLVSSMDDNEYYDRAPGQMHPETEAFVEDMMCALEIVRNGR